MSKALRTIGKVAGVVATVAAFIPGGQPIAGIAGAVAAISSTAGALTAKKPAAVGNVTSRVIGANNPLPYVMGRTMNGGVQVHEAGYGGLVNKVKNPYYFMAAVHSCCGPIDGFDQFLVDSQPVFFTGAGAVRDATGYYAGFLHLDAQLGARPEPDALQAKWGGVQSWGAGHKLSSMAALGWSAKFDKDGKVFAGDMPPLAAVLRGVRVYDPRLDSTRPGGVGPCRVTDEATWVYSANPALHAGTYAYGRWVNGKLVFGVDLGDAVDFGAVMAWANTCDANGWQVNGTIYEPGDRWNNLKLIAEAGGGEPVLTGGIITFRWHAPRVPLDTIRAADLAEGPLRSAANQPRSSRINLVRPKYRSEAHAWSMVQAASISIPALLAADGEEIDGELPYEMVTDADQAAELALYDAWNRREAGPFALTAGPRLLAYRPGDVLTIAADCELWPTDVTAEIRTRTIEPETATVTLELVQESTAKHAAVLGASAVPPPVPPRPPLGAIDDVVDVNSPPGAPGASAYNLIDIANVAFPEPGVVEKVGGSAAGWDAKAITAERFAGASISCRLRAGDEGFIGLDTEPTDNANFTTIRYGLYFVSSGVNRLEVFNDGVRVWQSADNFWQPGDVPVVWCDGKTLVRYSRVRAGVATEFYSQPANVGTPGALMHGVIAVTFLSTTVAGLAYSAVTPGADGDPGAPGADGVSQRRIWRRDVVQPAAPAPSAGTPAGWSDDHATATGTGLLWRADGERASGGTNYVWATPLRDEVLSQLESTGVSAPIGPAIGVSDKIALALAPGESRTVFANVSPIAPTGPGSWYVQIEYRQAGGPWQVSNGPVIPYNAANPNDASHEVVLVAPPSGPAIQFETRATVITSGADVGTLDLASSIMRV